MNNKSIRPENIIADGADHTFINGQQVRKGSVAAFLANISLLENPNSSAEDRTNALQAMRELAPSLIAVGIHHYVNFKNKQAEELLQNLAKEHL